jgi:hypothetical protein
VFLDVADDESARRREGKWRKLNAHDGQGKTEKLIQPLHVVESPEDE